MHINIKKIQRLLQKQKYKYWIVFLLIGVSLFWWQWQRFFEAHSQFVPTSGGTFTESTVGTTFNLNPLADQATIFDKDMQRLLFAGLLEYSPLTGQIGEGLASFRVSADGLEYYVSLKNSAKFSNGELVTTDDVLFTYETLLQNPNFRSEYLTKRFEYVQIQKINETDLVFILPEPNSYFPAVLTTPILYAKSYHKALIEEVVDPNLPANKRPIGAGPYKLENIVPEDNGSFRVFLEYNQHYFKKAPYIRHLVFYVYPSFDHVRFGHSWTTFFSQIPFSQLVDFQASLFGEYQAREYILPRFLGLFFNLDTDFVKQLALRRSLMFGTEKDKLLEKNKGWKRIDSLFFFEGIDAWHETDFAEGKRILQRAGFRYDEDKNTLVRKDEPVILRFITSTMPPVYSRFAQNLVQRWQDEYNLEIDLRVLDPFEFETALKNRDYDLVLFGQDYSENIHSLSTWHSSQSGQINLSNLTNQDIDFLINEIYVTGSQSELFELSKKLNDLLPAIPLATRQYNLLVSPKLKGFSGNFGKLRHHRDRFYGIENWYFAEEQRWDLPADSYKLWEFVKFLFSKNNAQNP